MMSERAQNLLCNIDLVAKAGEELVEIVKKMWVDLENEVLSHNGVQKGDLVRNRWGTFEVVGVDNTTLELLKFEGDQPILNGYRVNSQTKGTELRVIVGPWKKVESV